MCLICYRTIQITRIKWSSSLTGKIFNQYIYSRFSISVIKRNEIQFIKPIRSQIVAENWTKNKPHSYIKNSKIQWKRYAIFPNEIVTTEISNYVANMYIDFCVFRRTTLYLVICTHSALLRRITKQSLHCNVQERVRFVEATR